MRKYFSPYLEKLEKQDKNTRISLIIAAFGILLFLGIAITLPFRDSLFRNLFPKDPSRAQVSDVVAQRKQQVVDYFARGGTSTVCQNRISFALAALYKNTNVDLANTQIINAYNDSTCAVKEDKFAEAFASYFQMPHLWRIYLDPTMNSRLTPEAKTAILTMMWRWVNNRSTAYLANRSAWDIYGSENHEAIQASAFLLSLQALQDAPAYGPDKKLADGHTVAEHYKAWLGYWMRYFQGRAREGVSTEIASPGYAKYTVSSYYNIYDLTKSASLKNQAKNFLDLYWADAAQEFLPTGVVGGAETRAYKNLLSFNGEASLRTWLYMYDWFDAWKPTHLQILIPATSSYNPPTLLKSIARDTNKSPYSYITRRIGLSDTTKSATGTIRLPELTGPIYPVKVEGGSFIRRYSYVTPEYILGTLSFDPSKTYSALTDQNRLMGVFFSDLLDSRIVILGKGLHHCGITGYAETNGVAGPNTMIVGRDVRAKASDGTRVFIHDGKLRDNLSPAVENGWLFTRNDSAFVAIRVVDGGFTKEDAILLSEDDHDSDPATPVTCSNPKTANGLFLNLTNMWSPVVIQLGRASDFSSQRVLQEATTSSAELTASPTSSLSPLPTLQPTTAVDPFETFKAKVKTTPFTYSAGKLTYKSLNGDTFEYWAQSTNVAKINGDSNLNPPNTFESPYMKQVHGQGITTVNYGGQTLTINTDCTPVGADDCSAMKPPAPTPTPVSDKTPPVINITAPKGGSKVNANRATTIQANASDLSGIAKVEFYVENVLTCTDTSSPYSCSWSVPRRKGKKYDLKARAYDTKGNIGISPNVRVTSK